MKDVYETLHKLVNDGDWHNLSALSTALMSGEWDAMSGLEQDNWLEELND